MSSEFGRRDSPRVSAFGYAPEPSRWRARVIWATVPAVALLVLGAVVHAKHVKANKPIVPAEAASAPADPVSATATPVDEQHALAACHPHLIHAPQAVPQVETINMPAPGQAHMKIHLWVNGGGLVVRSQFVAGELGTAVEQQAATAYMRGLHFSVPENADCNRREIELIGDVFEAPTSQGDWLTLVRVYPRYMPAANGGVRTAE